jgi:hypothetical protein
LTHPTDANITNFQLAIGRTKPQIHHVSDGLRNSSTGSTAKVMGLFAAFPKSGRPRRRNPGAGQACICEAV